MSDAFMASDNGAIFPHEIALRRKFSTRALLKEQIIIIVDETDILTILLRRHIKPERRSNLANLRLLIISARHKSVSKLILS